MADTTTLKKSLLMIQKLKKRLQEQEQKIFEPIAIVGMSCRVPNANNAHEFWEMLCQGKNCISAIPDERWSLLKGTREPLLRDSNLAYWGGYLDQIEKFDPYFFGISPREALRMDPQQRILLEVTYESIEDAGLSVEQLTGSNTGVFSSLYASQFGHLQKLDSDMDALLLPTGSAISMAANRFSYLFDLRGPSLVLDTACSSSLVAIQLACLNLQAKTCEQAVVSAVNINLLPSIHSILAKATMLSPTGQCHTFDAKADGYVQGEGAGAIVLKPLSKAIKDQDRIYAVIAGSAVNQDGKTNGLTAPNGLQQEALLRSAYKAADIDPALVSYVECHGTGTFLGDPIEVQALGEVVGKNREQDKPCWISSVKTNIGHLEPAAGIVSVIKTALVLKNKTIPPHQNFTEANPHIPFDQYGLNIPRKTEKLPSYGPVCAAGVSGFGFGGANAHIVLRALAVEEQSVTPGVETKTNQELFTLSAKDTSGLEDLIHQWHKHLEKEPEISLSQVCYNLHTRRSHYSNRVAIITSSVADLQQKLKALAQKKQDAMKEVYCSKKEGKTHQVKRLTEFDGIDLPTLAELYTSHAEIDWSAYEANRCYAHADMPLYPWQHKSYWPLLGHSEVDNGDGADYPLRGMRRLSPLKAHQYEFVIDTKAIPEVKDSFNVLHAGFYLEMIAHAVNDLYQKTLFHIDHLSFVSPLVASESKTILVQLILEKEPDGMMRFAFHSHDGHENWVEHACGRLSSNEEQSEHFVSVKERLQKNAEAGAEKIFYDRILGMGMPAGDTIRWTNRYWTHQNEIFCELRQPKPSDRSQSFAMKMHPGIIDACIQTLFLLLPENITKPYVASQMEQVAVYRVPSEQLSIYAVLNKLDEDEAQFFGDWYLLDDKGHLVAKCLNVCMSQLNDAIQIDKIMNSASQFQLDLSGSYDVNKTKLVQYLVEQFACIFSMPAQDIDIHQSLHELGLDSLMAMAVLRVIESTLGVTYSLPMMMKGPSIHELAEYILTNKKSNKPKDELESSVKFTNKWLANRKAQANAQIRLFCFPFGGGGASIYREWQQACPDFIEICPIQLPGRENRLDETPLHDLKALVALLADNLAPLLDLPFAFIGHSFGSLIAFELARFLRQNNMPQPQHLFASAYPDPKMPSKSLDNLLAKLKQMDIHLFDLNQANIRQLDVEQFDKLSIIFQENGIVDYSNERMNKSIIEVLLPIFIGDMNIVKSYAYQDESPLSCDITVFLGEHDTWVLPEDHHGWAQHTTGTCDFQSFNSGHLFIREANIKSQIIETVTGKLSQHREVACEI